MRLAELQRTFWSAACERVQGAEQPFVGSPELSATERMSIYADMFMWRQVDSLREDFPKLAAVHDDFYTLAQAYLARHPSRHPSLARLGRELPAFLLDLPERSDLSDLAALEWARAEVFEETDAPVITQPTAFPTSLRIVPALRVLNLQHDVAAVWQSIEDGSLVPAPSRSPTTLVVWRKAYDVFHVRLDEAEAHALERAVNGETIEAVCAAFEREPEPVDAALRAVSSWFSEGWIADGGEGERP